ncbi:MAG: Asp-tRNA(Asn)/Glu-tRNA(Gln) amidotransferase subunit GatC [Lachnospiraceae bacterium]|nr:Asp-tRNA(Asn)/Glu-tRNA(Gln) amidotransferase subunit GatC [Ruminococcus sp.]MCM1274121.1 Asp-tRNA(Asn)/Glu-tRNA(Gln) amidotransferase subunit GatC [Lachnospiraceae bacterium]
MAIDVKHLAKLARLRIEDDKLEKFERDMESIVAMVEQLPEVSGDASGLDPEHPMKLREDVEGAGNSRSDKLSRNELLANAPKMQAGCVVVPKTVE